MRIATVDGQIFTISLECDFLDQTSRILVNNCLRQSRSGKYIPAGLHTTVD